MAQVMIEPVPDKDARVQLGELLKRARVHREFSHRDVASHTGVSVDTVKAWEDGTDVPRGRQWAKLKGMMYSLQGSVLVWRAALQANEAEEIMHHEREDIASGAHWTETEPEGLSPEQLTGSIERRVEQEIREAIAESPMTTTIPSEPPPPLEDPRAQTSFGQALRVSRLNMGLTQEELGALLDMSASAISSWETDQTMPVRDNWHRLVQALPELRECTPPGLRDVRYQGMLGGPRYVRARTQDAPVIVPGAEPEIARAGVEYAMALREEKKAKERVQKAREELERAEASHKAARVRVDEKQRALVLAVGGDE